MPPPILATDEEGVGSHTIALAFIIIRSSHKSTIPSNQSKIPQNTIYYKNYIMKVAAAIILVVIAVVANAQEEGAGKPNKKTDYLRALQEVEATSVLSLSLSFPAGIEGPVVYVADVSVQYSKSGKGQVGAPYI